MLMASFFKPLHAQQDRPQLLQPDDLEFLGGFRLPIGQFGESSFAYGGRGLAFRPDGDPNGPADQFPGSLYAVGHDIDQRVAEFSIPEPKLPLDNGATLHHADILQPFADITGGLAAQTIDQPKIGGLVYHASGADGEAPRIHWTLHRWYNVSGDDVLGHGSSALDLSQPDPQGVWRLDGYHNQMTAGYLLSAPDGFASRYLDGKSLIAGLNIQQGVATSSQGPAFFAFAPWQHEVQPPPNETRLDATPLLYYPFEVASIEDHKNPDEWEGAAWVTTDNKEAVVVVGRKSLGVERYGLPQEGDCSQHQGYHGDPYLPQILFYDPNELAQVANGEKEAWAIQPYLRWSPEADMIPTCEGFLTGAAFDAEKRYLYILQPGGDRVSNEFEPYPIVYVYRINDSTTPAPELTFKAYIFSFFEWTK